MSRFKPRRFEVVVVGGLIFGLCFVLMFAFRQARDVKRGEICQSNMKVIALASKQYERDYDEHFPLSEKWTAGLLPYQRTYKNSTGFRCPTASEHGYAMNKHLNGLSPQHLSTQNWQQIPQYFETRKLQDNASGAGEAWLKKPRHSQGVGVAFLDGHFEWRQQPPVFHTFAPLPKPKPQKKARNKNSRRN